jgi:Flp pilus assembly protein TadG
MTLVVSILLVLTLGAVEYGWLFLKQEQLTNASRQGARIAATVDATNSQVTTQISTMMTAYGLGSSGYTTTLNPTDVSTVAKGQTLSVKVSVPYTNIGITKFSLLPVPTTLSASVTMEKEGP